MTDLLWSPEAIDEVLAIADHYLPVDRELADRITSEVQTAPEILREFPGLGSPSPFPGVRKWKVEGAPYLLLYEVGDDQVVILRVVHAASDWQRRWP